MPRTIEPHDPRVESPWDRRLRFAALVVGRLGLGYLFLTQLFWKMPPAFGCGQDADGRFVFTTASADGALTRGSGLCDWIGIEAVAAKSERVFLAADVDNDGHPELSVDLGPVVRANGAFLETVVMPNLAWFGWVVFLMEALIAASMLLGLVTRLGALVALALSLQLLVGLGGYWNPGADVQEWEWSYHLMALVSVILLCLAPGRVLGLDAWLRPRLGYGRLSRAIRALT